MKQCRFWAALAALTCLALPSLASVEVELGTTRSGDWESLAMSQVKDLNEKLANMTDRARALRGDEQVFSTPHRVVLTRNGVELPFVPQGRGPEADITLQFDSSGPNAFPTEYRDYLMSVFAAAKPAMDGIFGFANVGGTVKVLNYDESIQARLAVSGGYYVHNAPTGPEIRFPVYQSTTSAAINFIHTLLLAYMGPAQYPFDSYNEGFVRAATITIARTAGAIPNSSPELIEAALDSLYDASVFYPYSNVPGLGAPQFIAPNLLNDPLPAGGSTGGIFLLRYQMAGTAWAKLLAQYPAFIRQFNSYYYLSPSSYQTLAQLEALGQVALNDVAGAPGAKVEGYSFKDWAMRQQILDVRINAGLKLVPQAFPIQATPGTSDFGVFGIIINAFRTDPFGNETLLNGTTYPIFWRPDNSRFFTSVQEDQVPINGAYGSLVPNFPGATFNNQVYRVAVDLPFGGKNVRVYLPAGAITTGTDSTPNNIYGTLTGFKEIPSSVLRVNVEWVGGSLQGIAVNNFAFGAEITDPTFTPAQKCTVRVFRVQGPTVTEIQTLEVNKGYGALPLDIRSPDSDSSFVFARQDRLALVGIPFEPYRPNPADVLGLPDQSTLVARFNPVLNRYDLYPDEGEFRQGLGYFTRATVQSGVLLQGRTSANTPISIHLQPGWNMVTVPGVNAVNKTDLQVTRTTEAISTWSQAAGILVGQAIFGFNPDPLNPDAGSLVESQVMEPGKAYFVRALKAEGAVLIFPAASGPAGVSAQIGNAPQFGQEPKGRGGFGLAEWRNRVTITSASGHYAAIEIGQKQGAIYGHNPKEDDWIAPGPGGLQLIVINGGPAYRDIRPTKRFDTYTVRINGLEPGKTYQLNSQAIGAGTRLRIYGIGGPGAFLDPGASISFTATSTAMTIQVVNQ